MSRRHGPASPVPLRALRHAAVYRHRAQLCLDQQRFTSTYRLARALMGAGR